MNVILIYKTLVLLHNYFRDPKFGFPTQSKYGRLQQYKGIITKAT